MNKKTAYIFGNGGLTKDPREFMEDEGTVVSCDAGYEYLLKYKIFPDLCIGDFDSENIDKVVCQNIIKLPIRKDETDTEYAVNYLIKKGYDRFVFFGMLGGNRFDHSLANIQILSKLAAKHQESKMYSPDLQSYLTMVKGPYKTSISGRREDTFSLFAYSRFVKGLYISGAAYPLNGKTISNQSPLCISNFFKDDEVKIEFSKGFLLIMIYQNKF